MYGVRVYPLDIVLLPLVAFRTYEVVYLNRTRRPGPQGLILTGFVAWGFLGVLVGIDPGPALNGALLWLRGGLVFLVVHSAYGDVYDSTDVLHVVLVLLAVQSVLGLIQGITQTDFGALNQYFGTREPVRSFHEFGGTRYLRVQGTLGNPNTFASWLLTLLPLLVVAIGSRGIADRLIVPRWTLVLVGTGSVLSVLLTASRGSILLLFGSAFSFVLLFSDRTRRATSLVGMGSGALLIGAMLVPAIRSRFLNVVSGLSKRTELIRLSLELVAERPVFGVGYNNFIRAVELFVPENDLFFRSNSGGVHNVPLLIAAEAGTVGLALFSAFLFNVLLTFLAANARRGWGISLPGGYLLSMINICGLMMIYLTFSHFQFLPLSMAVLGSGLAVCRGSTSDPDEMAT